MAVLQVLCKGFPQEFVIYFQYVRSLRFDEKPDYAYLRRLFRDLFAKEGKLTPTPSPYVHECVISCPLGWNWDFVFDWTILKYQRSGASGTGDRPLLHDTMSSARPMVADTMDLSQTRMRA